MTRIADTPQRGRRGGFLGTTGGRLLAAAVLLVAVVGGTQLAGLVNRQTGTTGSPTPSPTASPQPSDSPAPTESPSGEPSASPSPSPAGGELPTGPSASVMSFTPSCDMVPPVQVPATTVLEDGRVIWRVEDGRHVVRQLTPDSLDDFREQVRATGLFEGSGRYGLERRPGTPEPPGHGLCVWSFAWTDGDAPEAEVDAVMWLGDEEEAMYYQPSPERETLHALAQQLMDPGTWYGGAGWVQPEAVTFEPETYLVLASVTVPQLAPQGAPDFDEVAWPFDQPPDEFGVEYGTGEPSSRCGHASAEAVESLAAQLADAGLEQFEQLPFNGVGAGLPWAAREAAVDFSFWPVLPDGRPACDDAGG